MFSIISSIAINKFNIGKIANIFICITYYEVIATKDDIKQMGL